MQQLTLPSSSHEENGVWFQLCPKCLHKTPKGVVICWTCGYCMDAHIRELAEAVA